MIQTMEGFTIYMALTSNMGNHIKLDDNSKKRDNSFEGKQAQALRKGIKPGLGCKDKLIFFNLYEFVFDHCISFWKEVDC
jgi:hypothetical protein